MIPSTIAAEVSGVLRDFLSTGFGPSNPALSDVVKDFLDDSDKLLKGPYLSGADAAPSVPEGTFTSVVVDEAQDIVAQAWRLIRSIVPSGRNDLFIVGDAHQRIYSRHRVVLGRCGIDIRGRARKLRLNYRTTEETRRWASRLLDRCSIDDLDGGADNNRGVRSVAHGPEPRLRLFQSRDEQPHGWFSTSTISWSRASRRAGFASSRGPAANVTPWGKSWWKPICRSRCWKQTPPTSHPAVCDWPPCTGSRAWSSTGWRLSLVARRTMTWLF